MFPLAFIDAIADALEAIMGATHKVQTEPLDPLSHDKTLAVFPMAWTPEPDTAMIGQREPTINHYSIRIQNLTISGDIHDAYTEFTTDQRKIRAILYRDATLSVSLAGMTEVYLGSRERFTRMNVVRQATLPGRQRLGMYFLCETDVQIDTETVKV
jgi:hypothetical protein